MVYEVLSHVQFYLIQIIKGYTYKMESVEISDSLVSIICCAKDLLYICACVYLYTHRHKKCIYIHTHTKLYDSQFIKGLLD